MSKKIVFSESLHKKILSGADQVADSVKISVGPRGRNCLLQDKKSGEILILNEGFKIAEMIELEDPEENMGAKLIREAAKKTGELTGDGTTTAVILTQSMLHEAYQYTAAGYNPIILRKGMHMAAKMTAACITKMAVPASEDNLEKIAMIASGDKEIGSLVAKAAKLAGTDGVVKIEESMEVESSLEFLEGIVFERGYLHPLMITDQESRTAELNNPFILITDEKLETPMHLVPLLEITKAEGRDLLVIAEEISPAVIGLLMKNKQALGINIAGIQPPLYGEGRKWRLEDLAIQTGGTYISSDFGFSVKDVTEEMLGKAKHIKIEQRQTMITGADGDQQKIEEQKKKLRRMIEMTDYDFNKKRYQERLAKFTTGVSVVHVGGTTETEMKERKASAEHAYHAIAASREEGVVSGGGTAFADIIPTLQKFAGTLEGEKRLGVEIVLHALERPLCQIVENAGLHPAVIMEEVKKSQRGTGFDVVKEEYRGMMEAGILDPAKAVRLAILISVSAVGTILATEAGITDLEKEISEVS